MGDNEICKKRKMDKKMVLKKRTGKVGELCVDFVCYKIHSILSIMLNELNKRLNIAHKRRKNREHFKERGA